MGFLKADRKLMREINNMQVLQHIRATGLISRPELAEQTGLSLSTISNIVTELLESNLIREVGEGDSSGGRRPGLLDLNETARYVFGVKIGPEKVWISLFDLRFREIDATVLEFKQTLPPEKLFVQIAETITRLTKKNGLSKRFVLGSGVSTSGFIDSDSGTCLYSPILGWEDIHIREHLAALTKMDVIVENDVNAFAYGTHLRETSGQSKNLICITTGPGVGAGIIMDGRLYRGTQGGAGEFGHMSIDRKGPVCPCGRRGCLDVLASDQFLVTRAQELIAADASSILQGIYNEGRLSPESIFFAAQVGDEAAIEIYKDLGENLGFGVANLINLLNPDKIVIGGEGTVAAKFFIDSLRETATKFAFPHLRDSVEIVVDDGSEDVWLQGAAAPVIEKFFAIPMTN